MWGLLRGKGDPEKPTQIVNKDLAIWAKEFDMVLNMGKAATHRFHEGSHKWNYDGRSCFSANFHLTTWLSQNI